MYFGAPINVGPPTFFVFVLSVSAVVPITSSSSIYDIVSRKGGKGTVVLVQHNKANRSPAHHVFKHHQSIVFSCFFVLSYSTADAADAALRSSPISYI